MRFDKSQHIHFIGIGGIGMSGIAEILIKLGYQVSGSDLNISCTTEYLTSMGVNIIIGHNENNVVNADIIVVSSAIKHDNKELIAAHTTTAKILSRGEMLAELMQKKYGIAISGSHGKTTTTSMLAQITIDSGLDPTVIIGGKLNTIGSNAKLGTSEFLIAEVDESDGSFLLTTPNIGIITNIDFEHVDYYKDIDEIKNTFMQFINKIQLAGTVFVCSDDKILSNMIPNINRCVHTYGIETQADLIATNISVAEWNTQFHVIAYGKHMGPISLKVPGSHMVLNALAAIGVALKLGINYHTITNSLAQFTGAERRFQKCGEHKNILIIDDYGHHPTEIIATLQAAKLSFPDRRLIVAFQPHRYTRIKTLLTEFGKAFLAADKVFITDIYAASETPIDNITGQSIVNAILNNSNQDVKYVPYIHDLANALKDITKSGDIVITMGAGNITTVGPILLDLLKRT